MWIKLVYGMGMGHLQPSVCCIAIRNHLGRQLLMWFLYFNGKRPCNYLISLIPFNHKEVYAASLITPWMEICSLLSATFVFEPVDTKFSKGSMADLCRNKNKDKTD